MEGRSRYEYYLNEYLGVDPADGRAMYRLDKEKYPGEPGVNNKEWATYTKDGLKAKKHFAGTSIPDVYGGFSTSVAYKGITLSVSFSYQLGGKTFDGTYQDLMARDISGGRAMHKDLYRAWTKPGDITDVPALTAQSKEYSTLTSDRFLISSSALALKNVSLNYVVPEVFTKKLGLKGIALGAAAENAMDLYLRPETAQGIFVNYLNVQKTSRHKLPFGIAQIGKAFRNEIVARQFIFRMREFEQMEMQFFVPPGTELKFYEEWKQKRLNWHLALGLGEENYKFHDHEKLAHYANAAADIEFRFPFGFKELEGIHSRTDFDLSAHERYSGKKLQYFDPERNESYVPYVVETSVGLDRLFLALFSHCLKDEVLEDGSERTVLSLPPALAPVKAAILPLMKKDGMGEYAEKIFNDLKYDFNLIYEDKDSIGKRYRRQDAIGTPFCITIDHDTLTDHTVTIRHRDTMEQERVAVSELRQIIDNKVNFRNLLSKI